MKNSKGDKSSLMLDYGKYGKKMIKKAQAGAKIITDPKGQWNHPGKVTKIPSNEITMQDVNYPVLGVSDTNHVQMMYPNQDYTFNGNNVTEFPMKKAQTGARLVTQPPSDYKFLKQEGDKKYYTKSGDKSIAPATGGGKGGTDYEKWIQSQLQSGISPQELVDKKYIHPDEVGRYNPFYKPTSDTVYIQPQYPKPVQQDQPHIGFTGHILYDNNKHATAMYNWNSSQANTQGQAGMKDSSKEKANLMFVDQYGKPDISRGTYTIPAEKFDHFTNGVSTLKDTTGISQFKNSPLEYGGDIAASGIHINPKNKGKFNATKKATGKTTEELTHSKNPVTKKRAIFAQNAKKWKHGQDGINIPKILKDQNDEIVPLQDPDQTQQIQYDNNGNPLYKGTGAQLNQQQDAFSDFDSNYKASKTFQKKADKSILKSQIGTSDQDSGVNFYKNKYGVNPLPNTNLQGNVALGLQALDAVIPTGKPKRVYNKPEDAPYYNPNANGTGSQAIMQGGGSLPGATGFMYARQGNSPSTYEQGGELELYSPDSNAEHLSDSIIKFNGAEHGEKNDAGSEGIPISYGKSPVEVENDETGYKTNDGDFTVLGNMRNPITGRLFKNDGKVLAKLETKATKQMAKADEYLQADTDNPFELLKFNTGKAKFIGAKQKLDDVNMKKELLSSVQNQMLEFADRHNLNPKDMTKAKWGKTIKKAAAGTEIPRMWNIPGASKTQPTTSLNPLPPGYNVPQEQLSMEQPGVTFDDIQPINSLPSNDIKYKGADWRNYVKPLAAFSTPQSVKAQKFIPRLEQSYQQDVDLNPIIANTRTLQQQGLNASELATATGIANQQLYSAEANNFAGNLQRSAETINRNNNTINNSNFQNLKTLDEQYIRQTGANSNTRRQNIDALGQIANVDLENTRDWNNFNVMKQLYNTYQVNPDNFSLSVKPGTTSPIIVPKAGQNYLQSSSPNATVKSVVKAGSPTTTTYTSKSPVEQRLLQNKLRRETLTHKYGGSIVREQKLYKP